jgi:hypothetical protein
MVGKMHLILLFSLSLCIVSAGCSTDTPHYAKLVPHSFFNYRETVPLGRPTGAQFAAEWAMLQAQHDSILVPYFQNEGALMLEGLRPAGSFPNPLLLPWDRETANPIFDGKILPMFRSPSGSDNWKFEFNGSQISVKQTHADGRTSIAASGGPWTLNIEMNDSPWGLLRLVVDDTQNERNLTVTRIGAELPAGGLILRQIQLKPFGEESMTIPPRQAETRNRFMLNASTSRASWIVFEYVCDPPIQNALPNLGGAQFRLEQDPRTSNAFTCPGRGFLSEAVKAKLNLNLTQKSFDIVVSNPGLGQMQFEYHLFTASWNEFAVGRDCGCIIPYVRNTNTT